MYFKNRDDTNIDDEFNNDNIISNCINFIKKYKIVLIILILIILIIFSIFIFNGIGDNYSGEVVENIINYLDLNGEDVITIYQGSDYIEPGYDAYNSHNENLNKDVKINSNLNTKEIGEYEISYILGDIIKTRKIMVVEKPKVFTFIRLNVIDGKTKVYLKIGEEYKEPGYQVFSSTGENLNDRVVVTGDVDTSKKGTYSIVYSLIDSNGITVSVNREVVVMDIDINLSLSNNEYTNKDVFINVNVDKEFFEYMILPDNTKIMENSYSYKVSSNGKYTFKVYGSKGMVKEKSIEVKNIDVIGPTGSCVVDHDKNGSFITINANDISGIKKYSYNDVYYTNNKIVLNSYIESAIVMVYDKLDNVSKFNCKVLELKDELLIDTSHYTDMSGFNVYNVKTSSVNLTDLGCGVTSRAGSGNYRQSITVHQKISDNLHGILTNVCKYINKSFWISELQTAGAYVGGQNTGNDYHAIGLAIDLNNEWSYTFNGKKYRPYPSQGKWTWHVYNEFVCEVCGGKEDCEYNVNYIIYKRYFEGNGWCWGGNWGLEHFDPMHYEIRPNNKCAIGRKQKISC